MADSRLEQLAASLALQDRPTLIKILRSVRCSFPMDFTDEFLQTVSLERLRHIVLAAELHAHHDAAGPAA